MTAYYNEIEPYAAQWLRNLEGAGHIAAGTIDHRDIRDVTPEDIGHGQAHFFAGIGAWSHALRLAGVPDNASIWTGSAPCQPFSTAGKRKGTDDERHLWPTWYALIAKCRPAIVFGEQVASPDGRRWFDTVRAQMETLGYAVGAADMCAAGLGAPHIRQRLFWVAVASEERLEGLRVQLQQGRQDKAAQLEAARGGSAGSVGHADSTGVRREPRGSAQTQGTIPVRTVGDPAVSSGQACGLGDANETRPQGHAGNGDPSGKRSAEGRPATTAGFWSDCEWVPCRNPRDPNQTDFRPVEPGTLPLADGITNRVGRLRAYGNAIVPQVAAAFIKATLQTLDMEV